MAVNKDNVVEQKLVKMGQVIGALTVIEEGLNKDEWVIVNGIQRARPGGKVIPQKATAQKQSDPKPGTECPAFSK